MKRYITIIVIALIAMTSKAQTTYNVRAGGTYFQLSDGSSEPAFAGFSVVVESNIPIGESIGKFVFSPSAFIAYGFRHTAAGNINIPLHFGCKIPLGNNRSTIFIPKLGPTIGYSLWGNASLCIGPSIELPFETRHFVVAANGYLNCLEGNEYGVFFTCGYKF